MRSLLGFLAVALLRLIARLPLSLSFATGALLLPLYIPFRRRTRVRLGRLSRGGLRVAPPAYYRTRLRLALLSLRHLFQRPDGTKVCIEGRERYAAALASGKPVVILGWHQGPVELLHRIPHEDPAAVGHPAFLLTAKAFAPALTKLMQHGRAGTRKEILHPHSLAALKRWEKEKGILALMIDQVPGKPEEWLAPLEGCVQVPYPGRLLDWLAQRDAEFLVVSVRLENTHDIAFRYEFVDSRLLREDLAFHLDRGLRAAPEQYNWSYPKIR
jgi:hypothetical protein